MFKPGWICTTLKKAERRGDNFVPVAKALRLIDEDGVRGVLDLFKTRMRNLARRMKRNFATTPGAADYSQPFPDCR
jgi:hypothetical protein